MLFFRNINRTALLITIIISCVIQAIIININSPIEDKSYDSYFKINYKIEEDFIQRYKQVEKVAKAQKVVNKDEKEISNKKWRLEIESIGLNANISEGTDFKTLNKYIGHFENTKKAGGNIGLAAHNRGYKVNYFQNIKKLKSGDKITYFYNGKKYIYKVFTNYIILDTDWSVLEENNKREITLITCVENEPSLRRCVKGILVD